MDDYLNFVNESNFNVEYSNYSSSITCDVKIVNKASEAKISNHGDSPLASMLLTSLVLEVIKDNSNIFEKSNHIVHTH